MAIHTYMTDREHDQSSLDRVARMIFDRASQIMADGNPVNESVKVLAVISNVAVFAGFSNTAINTYYAILEDECKRSGEENDY